MGDKFRQIERFVDLLDSAFRESSLSAGVDHGEKNALSLCDMGSGKGYLTFAAYDFFQRLAKAPATVTGVEARPELVRLCNRVAEECGFERLKFLQSTIEEFPLPALDILVALHACDTATDDALAAGVRAGAAMILVAPCCQKEIRPQVDKAASGSPLRDVLRHGIFAERHAEIVTDALRALLMERAGYCVRVCEFVAPEHTAKNIMIIATRHSEPLVAGADSELERRILELKSFYGIQHHRLQQLLMEGRQLGCAAQAADPVS
jgi:SAM-dependent methyltransferase